MEPSKADMIENKIHHGVNAKKSNSNSCQIIIPTNQMEWGKGEGGGGGYRARGNPRSPPPPSLF